MTGERLGFSIGDWIAGILFTFFFGLYLFNVLIRKAIIMFGWEVFHFGNVGEFLILLAAAIMFIVVALHRESVFKIDRTSEKR